MMVATIRTWTGDGVTHWHDPGTQYLIRVELIRDGWAIAAHGGLGWKSVGYTLIAQTRC